MKRALDVKQQGRSAKSAKAGSGRAQRPLIAAELAAAEAPPRAATGHREAALTPERDQLVSVASYYGDERRGFPGTSPERDWNEGEEGLDDLLAPWGLGRRAP